MVDIQNTQDFRGIDIDSVGVCDLQIQIKICDEPTLAHINLGVSLDKNQKGIHMSRLGILINDFTVLNNSTINDLLKNACKCQNSSASVCEILRKSHRLAIYIVR